MQEVQDQRSPNRRFLLRQTGNDRLREPASQFTNDDSQWFWRLAKYCWSTDHLASPHITNEPPYVAHCTPNEITRRSAPRASEHVGEWGGEKGEVEEWR